MKKDAVVAPFRLRLKFERHYKEYVQSKLFYSNKTVGQIIDQLFENQSEKDS